MRLRKIALVFCVFGFSLQYSHAQSVIRTLSQNNVSSNGSIDVTLKIGKGDIQGLAKYQEQIPAGFSAAVTNKSLGKLKIADDGSFKIQWLNIPANDTVLIEYKLKHLNAAQGSFQLKGRFSYLKDGKQTKLNSSETTITVGSPALVQTKKDVVEDKGIAQNVTSKKKVQQEQKVELVKPKVQENFYDTRVSAEKDLEKKTEEATVTPEIETRTDLPEPTNEAVQPLSSIVPSEAIGEENSAKNSSGYSVQIGAFTHRKDLVIFSALPDVYELKVNGLYKYYSGKFTAEAQARARIEEAKNAGIMDAFLVKN